MKVLIGWEHLEYSTGTLRMSIKTWTNDEILIRDSKFSGINIYEIRLFY